MNDQIVWFATRGAGAVSLVLLTGVACLGILTVGRFQRPGWPRFFGAELHRSLALLSIGFLAVHVITAIVDPYTSLGLATAVVPFASSYRPLWVGLGAISVDLGIAIVATSLLRDRIGRRTWRVVHWLAYAAWPLALAHSIGSGSDNGAIWMLAIDAASVAAVGLAGAWRILTVEPRALDEVVAGGGRPAPRIER
jgi:methionine sulfoxide reductase heme-binding subunit